MSFIRKYSGDRTKPIVAVYTCPEHGKFDATVERDENGEAPDVIACPVDDPYADCIGCGGQPSAPGAADCDLCNGTSRSVCSRDATWTPSPVAGRVRLVEVVRGKWEKPEHRTYLDTRELGEGQDPEEFWDKREAIWDDERHKMIKDELL